MRKREKNYPHIAALNVHEQSHRGRREKEVSTPLGFTTPCTSGAKKNTTSFPFASRPFLLSQVYSACINSRAEGAEKKRLAP